MKLIDPELGTCPTCGSLRRDVRGTCVYTAIPGVRPPLPSLCGDSWHSEPLAPAKPESQTYPEMLAEIVKLSGRLDVTEFKAIVARREQEVARACAKIAEEEIAPKSPSSAGWKLYRVWHEIAAEIRAKYPEAFAKEGM